MFLNYRGDELRHGFVSHLVDAFERHEIKFFVDKYEVRGKDLKSLVARIEESRIALAIFSTRFVVFFHVLDYPFCFCSTYQDYPTSTSISHN